MTQKEIDVMELLIQGRRDREIGAMLGCGRRLIVWRISRICNKLGALTRSQAAAIYARSNMKVNQ